MFWFKKKTPYIGAIDSQTIEQKAFNYKLNEVCASVSPVIWEEKNTWNKYPIRDQSSSCQCVCMTLATEMGIIAQQKYGEFIDFSSSFLYQQRTNKNLMGCSSYDVYSVFPKFGNILESIMPSQKMTESQAMSVALKNYYKDLAKPFTINRIELPIDFETVASTIQATGKGVMLWFRFSHDEWTDIPKVLSTPTTSGHSVTAVDFLLKDGKKYLVVQDSWGLSYAINGYRFISEEYFKARCYLASYLKSFQKLAVSSETEKPKFDGTIISAQKCFQYEGLFPVNVPFIENWGPVTRKACIDFQLKYNISPAYGNFGPVTKAKLSELYK